MKLLLINYEFPPLGGGAGNATQNTAKELARQGHKVLVLTTYFQGLLERELIDGYEVVRVHSQRKRVDRSNPIEMERGQTMRCRCYRRANLPSTRPAL